MKTNSFTLSEILSHYDGSLEQTLVLLNVIKQMSENTQLLFMHLILSVCQFASISQETVRNCFPPTNTYAMSIRLIKNSSEVKGVVGNYHVMAVKRCSDGSEQTSEILFSTRSGKILYLLCLALCSFANGMGFHRSQIRLGNKDQYEAITRLYHLIYGKKVTDDTIHDFVQNISRYATVPNYFSRTKRDTNARIVKSQLFDATDANYFIINGEKNERRTIEATLDLHSDAEIIDCLRDFAQATTTPTIRYE